MAKKTSKNIPFESGLARMRADGTIQSIPISQIILDPTEMELAKQEVLNSQKYDVAEPPTFVCKNCDEICQPYPHQTIYYELCDNCFAAFDQQKMAGRIAKNTGKDITGKYFLRVTEWIKNTSK